MLKIEENGIEEKTEERKTQRHRGTELKLKVERQES